MKASPKRRLIIERVKSRVNFDGENMIVGSAIIANSINSPLAAKAMSAFE